jgi:flagellar basal body-associated protein FliL
MPMMPATGVPVGYPQAGTAQPNSGGSAIKIILIVVGVVFALGILV